MRTALGKHPDARLLWPIPGKSMVASAAGQAGLGPEGRGFRVFYAGNLREYAPMLQAALQAMKGDPSVRLEVRGTSPRWPAVFREEMRSAGMYHDFAPHEQLYRWLVNADAFLVTSAFEPSMRRMMETNFPSKLLEFARFGKPLVLWGPEYSTLIRWGQSAGRGLCVTKAEPLALRSALEHLARSTGEQARLGAEALRVARTDFDPASIQERFIEALRDAIGSVAELGRFSERASHPSSDVCTSRLQNELK
jgi:glycosyltransferase involved in cell wall biosynthesis